MCFFVTLFVTRSRAKDNIFHTGEQQSFILFYSNVYEHSWLLMISHL